MQRLTRALPVKLASGLAIGAAISVTLVLAVAGAAAAEANRADTVFISGTGTELHFEAPKTIRSGEELTILNTTDPTEVGPHTFALVTPVSIPKTQLQQQICNTANHICKAIAGWHGVKANGQPTRDPAKAGAQGWDTLGSVTKKGDSWFTGIEPGATITQKVSAKPGTTLYFMCALHSWMHGKIKVLP